MPVRPPPLEAGSHIRILSPSGPVTDDLVRPGVDVLESWGMRVTVDHRAFERERYLAGPDTIRAAAVNDALRDDDVDAIVFSRGGYGAMRILDDIDWAALARRPKFLCGFSDVTAIHLAALEHADIVTLHGPVAKSFRRHEGDLPQLRSALLGDRGRDHEVDVLISGSPVRGRAVGGNLSLLVALLATSHMPPLDGAVLFLEDVGEADYRLDRLFTALRLAPSLRNIAGVVLGDFVDCEGVYFDADEIPGFVARLGRELGESLQVPVVGGFPFGHGHRNVTLMHGAPVVLDPRSGRVHLDPEDAGE